MTYEIKRPPKAVILATGVGSPLRAMKDDCPTCLMSVGGSAIIERTIRNCLSYGISQIVLVLGHEDDQIRTFVDKTFRGIRVTYVINDQYRDTSTGYSLMLASAAIGASEFIILDAGLVFDGQLLGRVLDTNMPDVVCIDRTGARAETAVKVVADEQMRVLEISKCADPESALGISIGIDKISAKTSPLLFSELSKMMENSAHGHDTHQAAYASLMVQGTIFHAVDVTGLDWSAVDKAEDLAAANAMFGSPIATVSRGQQRIMDEVAAKEAMTI